MRSLALADAVEPWPRTMLREKHIEIGAKMVRHERYVIIQMAEISMSWQMFGQILPLMARLRAPPAPA